MDASFFDNDAWGMWGGEGGVGGIPTFVPESKTGEIPKSRILWGNGYTMYLGI